MHHCEKVIIYHLQEICHTQSESDILISLGCSISLLVKKTICDIISSLHKTTISQEQTETERSYYQMLIETGVALQNAYHLSEVHEFKASIES